MATKDNVLIVVTQNEIRVLIAQQAMSIVSWAHNPEVARRSVIAKAAERILDLSSELEDAP